jgi:hypothetical protein
MMVSIEAVCNVGATIFKCFGHSYFAGQLRQVPEESPFGAIGQAPFEKST